jgi:hypothetical protein
MGCGTDAVDDLSAGAFNEADSHKSFLEALNEWRNGGNSAAVAADGAACGGTSKGTVKAAGGGSMEVQTEARTHMVPQRPASASKVSYFQKFAINTASRDAGQCANGKLNISSFPCEMTLLWIVRPVMPSCRTNGFH